jgi:hypothetical protein
VKIYEFPLNIKLYSWLVQIEKYKRSWGAESSGPHVRI